MTGALVRKEMLQHWWAFVLIGLLSLLAVGWILLFTAMQGQGGSQLFTLRVHVYFLSIFALILGNRLVVAEYSSKTQIFLESLPFPRGRIVMVKYTIGLTVILLCAVTALGAAMLAGARTEAYTPRFAGILASRYLGFAVFAYTFFFAMGFLGRFRFMAYGLTVAALLILIRIKDLSWGELPFFYLVGGTLPFEREQFPTTQLVITGGLTLVFFLLALGLAVTREGSVSSLMGEKMSHRDKISLTALIFGLLAAIMIIEETKEKEPYEMAGGAKAEAATLAKVTVSPASRPAETLAQRLGEDLDAMAEFLELDSLPPIFIIQRPDLDPDRFEHGWLDESEGIILRTAFEHQDWRYASCLEQLTGDVIESASNGRAMKEDRFWVIDGFSVYWPHQGDATRPLDTDRHLLLRALYGTEVIGGIREPEDLRRWFLHQEAVGHQITAGIGWSLLRVLEQEAGRGKARAFMRSVLASDTPKNVTTTIRDLRYPIEMRFHRITGLELAAFLQTWNQELDQWRKPLSEEIAAIPRLEGALTFSGEPGATSLAEYRFEPPTGGESPFFERPVLLYGETAPFRDGLPESQTLRYPLSSTDPSDGFLRETWGSGTGIAWTFAADSPELRCRLISGWRHQYVP